MSTENQTPDTEVNEAKPEIRVFKPIDPAPVQAGLAVVEKLVQDVNASLRNEAGASPQQVLIQVLITRDALAQALSRVYNAIGKQLDEAVRGAESELAILNTPSFDAPAPTSSEGDDATTITGAEEAAAPEFVVTINDATPEQDELFINGAEPVGNRTNALELGTTPNADSTQATTTVLINSAVPALVTDPEEVAVYQQVRVLECKNADGLKKAVMDVIQRSYWVDLKQRLNDAQAKKSTDTKG